MTPLETLKAARDLISDPARWTQGEYARDANRIRTQIASDEAVCFCAQGAIYRVGGISHVLDAEMHLNSTCRKRFGRGVYSFNDTHTHAEVIALFDAAIAELEGV
jgi:hypothetical protein